MLLGFLIVVWSLHCAYAQNTSVSCSSTYDWMRNSKSQSPCLIAAWLQYSCVGAYEVGPPIYYLGPTNGTAQPWAGLGGIPPWPSFSQHCPSVAAQQYPEAIPNGTLIPSWAYLPLLNNTFDVKAAQYIASLDGPATDTTSTMPSEPPQLSQFTSAPLSTSLASSASASPSDTAQQARSHHMEGSALVGVIVVSHERGSDQRIVAPMLQDPNDPRTFPPSPTPADIYFYRCRQKAAAQALASDRSDTDVTIGGVPTSTSRVSMTGSEVFAPVPNRPRISAEARTKESYAIPYWYDANEPPSRTAVTMCKFP
ncbi:hypothetical protein LXA43DRAFT_1101280 [Ganoderma leucocontextum]|nr:hypothetical protein LXA43DRAFT_1101280 [Ganoderma leucocontextum]